MPDANEPDQPAATPSLRRRRPATRLRSNCGANGSNATNAITFTLSPGEAAVCTYTNTGIGSIQVCKDVVPNDATTWNFTVAGPSAG